MRCRGRQLDWLAPLERTGLDYNCTQVISPSQSCSFTLPLSLLLLLLSLPVLMISFSLQRGEGWIRRGWTEKSRMTNEDLALHGSLPGSRTGRGRSRLLTTGLNFGSRFGVRGLDQYFKNWAAIELQNLPQDDLQCESGRAHPVCPVN